MSGNSESMIEKVAEALCAQWSIVHKLPIAGDVRQFYIDSARAAIEAMHEPTRAMMVAAFEADDTGDAMSLIRTEWQAMLAAALSPS